jgi:hypothetical protein
MLAKIIFIILPFVILISAKSNSEKETYGVTLTKTLQDSLPLLHTLKDNDIADVQSSFENQTITIILKDKTVYIYSRPEWDYENYYPSTVDKIKKAIVGITMTFTKCETPPAFPGGDESWKNYIIGFVANHKKAVSKAGSGEVTLHFIVHIHGQITDISTMTNSGNSKLAELATEAIKNSPAWICGKQNGRDVIASGTKTITFVF